MIDLILIGLMFGMFYAGFRSGNQFKTLREMGKHWARQLGL